MRISSMLFCLLFLAACSRAGREDGLLPATPLPASDSPAVPLTLAVNDLDLPGYRPLVEQFEQEQAGIRVRLIRSSEAPTAGEGGQARALASTADVFASEVPRGANPDYQLDLRPFIDADPDFDPDDFYPHLLMEYHGRITTIPVHATYPLIYYDRDSFDAAGVAYPQNGWTPAHFLATAQQVTRRHGEEIVQWGYLELLPEWSPLLAAKLDAPAGKWDQPRFEERDVIGAINWLSELFTVHQVSPWLPSYGEYGAFGYTEPAIRNRKAAMWLQYSTATEPLEALVPRLGAVAVPEGDHGLFAEPAIRGYSISAGTSEADAAWQLVSFLSRQPPLNEPFHHSLPVRRSVAVATNFWQRLPEAGREALLYSVENTQPHRRTSPLLYLKPRPYPPVRLSDFLPFRT
jgi:multiple sugar transport system substrate-binding protein